MYCPRCMKLIEDARCPECGGAGREPQAEDLCLAAEKDGVFAGMLEDVLRQEQIPCLSRGVLGAGLSSIVGMRAEVIGLYVPYAMLDRAQELDRELFGGQED